MRLLPRDEQFFELFIQVAQRGVDAARQLGELLASDGDRRAYLIESISRLELEADQLTHDVTVRLDRSFITPLDREDIHELTSRLDDVLDYVDAVAKRLVTFRISVPTHHAIELGRIIARGAEETAVGIALLRDLSKSEAIIRQCAKINQLENDADQVMRDALNDLFNGAAKDPLEVIKWMDIYEHLELATDKCEDVANIIESVLVKYS
jgi:predicted phosphate transport protein (TIGR00153 family)